MNFNRSTAILVFTVAAAVGCNDTTRVMPTAPSLPATQLTPSVPTPSRSGAMAGSVSDAAWRPLSSALVEIIDGPHAGLSTTTNSRGDFGFAGTFDESTRIRASKEGHVASIRTVNPFCERCNPNWWVHFYLESLATSLNLAGDYAVTFVADSACVSLPQEVRTRRYEASITLRSPEDGPANSLFRVALTGARFTEHYGAFDLRVAGDYVVTELGDAHGGAGVVEEVAADSYLLFAGRFEPSVTDPSSIEGALVGSVDFCKATNGLQYGDRCPGSDVPDIRCPSANHRLIMRRR